MKILVLEDSASDFIRINQALTQHNFEVIHAPNSKRVFKILKEQELDLLLFDIELEREDIEELKNEGAITGISVAKKVLNTYSIPIVFLTQYYDNKTYFKEAQKLGIPAKHFLSKNGLMKNEDVFVKTIEDAIEEFKSDQSLSVNSYQSSSNRKIGIRKGSGQNYYFYSKDEIVFIEAKDQLVYFHFEDNNKISLSTSLNRVIFQLNQVYDNFLKIDRNHYINLEKIKSLNGHTLYFSNGVHILLSAAARLKLKKENLIIITRPKNN